MTSLTIFKPGSELRERQTGLEDIAVNTIGFYIFIESAGKNSQSCDLDDISKRTTCAMDF